MKTVYKSAEVYHLWAHESQAFARNPGGRMSFDGARAYSYRAVIGRILRNPAGAKAFWASNRRWSVTTSSHQSDLRRAIPPGFPVFRSLPEDYSTRPAEGVAAYAAAMADAEAAVKRARARKAWRGSELLDLIQEAESFAAFFGLPALFDAASVRQILAEQAAAIEVARLAAEAEAVKAEARERRKLAEARRVWLAGGDDYRIHRYPDTLLRVKGSEVQTSRGAVVPLYAARRALALYQAGRPLAGRRIGHYHVTSADPKSVVVGCHRITRREVNRFAATLTNPN